MKGWREGRESHSERKSVFVRPPTDACFCTFSALVRHKRIRSNRKMNLPVNHTISKRVYFQTYIIPTLNLHRLRMISEWI